MTESITIDAPVATVVQVISDLENTERWANEAKSAEVLARDDEGRPSRMEVTLGAIGFTTTATYDVTYADTAVSLHGGDGSLISRSTIDYVAVSSGSGTELTMTAVMEVTVPVPDWGLVRAMGSSARKNLESVKKDAENA